MLQYASAFSCLTASSSCATSSGGNSCICCCWVAGSPQSLTVPEPLPVLSCPMPSRLSRMNCWEPCWRRESACTGNEPLAAISCFWMVLKGSAFVKTGGGPLSGLLADEERLLGKLLLLFKSPDVMSRVCWAGQRSPDLYTPEDWRLLVTSIGVTSSLFTKGSIEGIKPVSRPLICSSKEQFFTGEGISFFTETSGFTDSGV